MGLILEVDYKDLKKASQSLRDIQLRAEDISGAGKGIRLILQSDVDERFMSAPATETGGQVYGGQYWEALSNTYLVSRSDRRNGQILRDTGELMQSMTSSGSPYGIWAITTSEFVFGTALAKAQKLQRIRPFLFWHPQLLQKVAEYLANYIGGL